jgi:hypothetical protein
MAVTRTKGRSCAGKQRHATRAEAEAHRRSLIVGGAHPSRIVVYPCNHCDGGFHVGHKGRKRR